MEATERDVAQRNPDQLTARWRVEPERRKRGQHPNKRVPDGSGEPDPVTGGAGRAPRRATRRQNHRIALKSARTGTNDAAAIGAIEPIDSCAGYDLRRTVVKHVLHQLRHLGGAPRFRKNPAILPHHRLETIPAEQFKKIGIGKTVQRVTQKTLLLFVKKP